MGIGVWGYVPPDDVRIWSHEIQNLLRYPVLVQFDRKGVGAGVRGFWPSPKPPGYRYASYDLIDFQ